MCFFSFWFNKTRHKLYDSIHIIDNKLPNNKIDELCPICLEYLYDESNKINYIHLKCCKQTIHINCLIKVYDFGNILCPICRTKI